MNKRFFTLMAAVLLAGGAVPYVAYAQADENPIVQTAETTDNFTKYTAESDLKLANGVKFIVKTSDGKYVAVKKGSKVKNGTFMVVDSDAPAVTPETAAVFEVRNYTKNGLGVTFSLYVEGDQYAVGDNPNTDASLLFTANAEKFSGINAVKVATVDGSITNAFGSNASSVTLGSYKVQYTAALLNDNNRNGITLSFDSNNLEGNVFDGVKAITIPVPVTRAAAEPDFQGNNIYLVKGKDADIDKFVTTQNKTNASKLTFVYVKNEQYKIDALVAGEGYKLVTINGADFYAEEDKAALVENAAFTSIVEGDALNGEGLLEMVINPKVGSTPAQVANSKLVVAAVKPSATDTKTYVTLVNKGENAGSKFTAIYPSLSGNTFFAASEFLNKNAISAYNIYFTSNSDNKSTATASSEYHKYLALGEGELVALAKSNLDLNTPYAQWVVTHFDEKYTLTLTNRTGASELEIKLQATENAGEYKIIGGGDADTEFAVSNDDDENVKLDDTTIKLLPVEVSKTDGFLALSEADIKAGIKLAFSGASATVGEKTYYAGLTDNGNTNPVYRLAPVADAGKALSLKVAAVEYEEGEGVIETAYAYIDSKGRIAKATEHPDSLLIPAYTFSYTYTPEGATAAVTKYASVNEANWNAMVFNQTDADDATEYSIVKALNGKYVLVPAVDGDNSNDDVFDYIAVGVFNTEFKAKYSVLNPAKDNFAYVSVNVNDNSDKTSLSAQSRHATFESEDGAISFRENKNGILEGVLSAQPMTFWLDSADSEKNTPSFYISKGIAVDTTAATKAYDGGVRNFLYTPVDSAVIFDEETAIESVNGKYILEGTESNLKAIFRPANLIAEDTLTTVVDGKEVKVTGAAVKAFQYGICLLSEDVDDEYVVYSKLTNKYLYSLNGKLGFTGNVDQALVVTLGAGDPTANEAIEAESGIEVIGGQGVVTVQGAAGKVITVANILGQTIANQVAASDNVTIAAPAGIVVVSVDGEATKVIVK